MLAVTVTVYVLAGGIRLKPPPTQPVRAETPHSAANDSRPSVAQRRLCLRGIKSQPSKARAGSAAAGPAGTTPAPLLPARVCCVWMLSVVVADVLPGVMLDCPKVAVAPGGRPLAANVTAGMVAPFCAVTVRVNCAELPGAMEIAGMADAITAVLAGEIERIVGSDGFKSRLEPLGVLPTFIGGDALVKFQQSELAKWGKAVHDAGVRID